MVHPALIPVTLNDLRYWMTSDLHSANIQFLPPSTINSFRAKIFTATNEYLISATEARPDYHGYLGCIATARKARPGEGWRRGNDLPDGPLDIYTWRSILAGIVRYEAQRISPASSHDPVTKSLSHEVPSNEVLSDEVRSH